MKEEEISSTFMSNEVEAREILQQRGWLSEASEDTKSISACLTIST